MNHAVSVSAVALGASLAIAGLLSSTDVEGAAGAGARAAGAVGAARASSITSINNFPRANVNVSRDVNIDVDNRLDYHPLARAAAVPVVVGAVVHTLPPACSAVVLNGITYQNCGGAWYQPQFAGTQVTYVVVNAPQ